MVALFAHLSAIRRERGLDTGSSGTRWLDYIGEGFALSNRDLDRFFVPERGRRGQRLMIRLRSSLSAGRRTDLIYR